MSIRKNPARRPLTAATRAAAVALATWLTLSQAADATQEIDRVTALDELQERIELAYRGGDLAGLEAARAALLAAGPDAAAGRAPYFAAYARFRQGLLAGDDGRARGWLEDCIRELDAYVARQPADAEARALLGSCYGLSTRHNRLGMASRGLEARRHIAAARELAPANPWVLLQDGLADYSTPRLFGGDRKAAIAKLERATALFAALVQEGSRAAAWGAAEAWLQLGTMYGEADRAADAIAAVATARRLAPAQQLAAL